MLIHKNQRRTGYRVCFLNEFARGNTIVRPCQRTIIIRSARSRERAVAAAKERFARLEGIRDWRIHAKIIEVDIIDADSPQGMRSSAIMSNQRPI